MSKVQKVIETKENYRPHKQELEVRIIGDNGGYIDKTLLIEPLEYNLKDEVTIVAYPSPDEIDEIHEAVCGQSGCKCEKHQYYRMRDIYNDGNIRLEIFMERLKQ